VGQEANEEVAKEEKKYVKGFKEERVYTLG
jgi:hypothetical protein